MARTTIIPQSLLGAYPIIPLTTGAADLGLTPKTGGVISYQAALTDSKTVVVVVNTDTADHNITFSSVADSLNRPGDIAAYVVVPGMVSIFGPFKTIGWANAGFLNIDFDSDLLQIAVLNLP